MSNSKTYEDRLSASAFLEAFRRKKNKLLMEELHITEEDVRVFFKGTPKAETNPDVNKKSKPKTNGKAKNRSNNSAAVSENRQEGKTQSSGKDSQSGSDRQ